MKHPYRKSLLLGSSMLAFNAALAGAISLAPNPAQASCLTVSSDTIISDSSTNCITWNSNNISITSAGTINANTVTAINVAGSVGSLTNNGTVVSNYAVLYIRNHFTTITNDGLFSGTHTVIYSPSASGGTIINNGTINAGPSGGLNVNGSLTSIINTGTITSTGVSATDRALDIFAIVVQGIDNSGTISGNDIGIWDHGGSSIASITNSGTIIGGSRGGIDNESYLGGGAIAINNSGTISGGIGINNSGILGGGATAILSTGTIIGGLTNSGTIIGNIIVNQDLSIAGGTGTLTGGTITTNNHDLVLVSGSNQVLDDNINVGASNTVSVSASSAMQLNNRRSVTGNYFQDPSGLLVIGVTNNSSYGDLVVSGNLTMTNDHISIAGSDVYGGVYTIAQAGGSADYSGITASISNGHDIVASISSASIGGFHDLLATITSPCQVVNGNTTTSNSVSCLAWNAGNLSITGSGSVSGASTGILNLTNNVGTLTNNGSIGGSVDGVYNNGTIGSIVNGAGASINGNTVGIQNSGIISNISNGGVISGGANTNAAYGIENSGTIGVITNSGAINAVAVVGIFNNDGSIKTISNSGSINGGRAGGINLNGGSIGTIINSANATINGLVSSGSSQANGIINNGGSIGVIANYGTIYGNFGIGNNGSIYNISNAGTLNGSQYGISNSGILGGGATVILSTGTIIGGITNSGTISGNIIVNQALSITGATGTLTGGTITTNNHDLTFVASSNQVLDDNINVGASNTVSVGANSTLQLNTPHTITGNYFQDPSALLVVGVTNNSSYGNLIVSNNATMTNDQISITGSYVYGGVYTIAQASGSVDYSGITVSITSIHDEVASISSASIGGFHDLLATITSSCQAVNGNTTTSNSVSCLAWNAGNLSIAGSGTISGASTGIINIGHNVGTLTNNGSISGSVDGVYNTGTIASIINNSTIAATQYGIYNDTNGTIGSIVNGASASINGNTAGIGNNSYIGLITNNGTIAAPQYGIDNTSVIETIINGGQIVGNANGIINTNGSIGTIINNTGGSIISTVDSAIGNVSGSIGTIINNNGGLINGATEGIYYGGTSPLGIIVNSGTIAGGNYGIINDNSTITSISNNPTGTLSGGQYGISNSGLIGGGGTAINSSGAIIGGLANSGTISGNIIVNQALSIAGGAGTLTGGTIITNNHDLTFAAGSNQVLDDNINVGVSNTVSIGASSALQLNAPHSITGNYSQDPSALLVVGVTNNSSYGDLVVSGNLTMTNDQISIVGSGYALGSIYTIVQAGGTADYSGIAATISLGHEAVASISSASISGFHDLLATITSPCQAINGNTTASNSVSCLAWNAGNLSIASPGTVSGTSTGIVNIGNNVGTLTNNGSIHGSPSGTYNGGTIASIINTNQINGSFVGIYNDYAGSIGIVNNANGGQISGGNTGIYNLGSITTVTNSGIINSGNGGGISIVAGSVGSIINESGGTIHGSFPGIGIAGGMISDISNASGGTISGGTVGIGIGNGATISAIHNSGLISGGSFGVYNNGSLGALTNSSTISGSHEGLYNDGNGTISSILNSGLITGGTAILSNGTILSAISNTGTIAGNINVVQPLTFTGGNSSTVGTLTGYNGSTGTITTNNNNLTFDANAYQWLNDMVNVGSSNTIINNGTLRVDAPQSITGNYSQGNSGLLVIGVSSTSSYGKLLISGGAVMANDHVLIVPTTGSLVSGETFTIVHANATGTDYSNLAATASGFTVTTSSIMSGGFDDLVVALSAASNGGGGGGDTYGSIGSSAGGGIAPAVGSALDQIQNNIGNGGDASFAPILTVLNNLGAQSQQAEQHAIQQLAPSQLAPQMASSTVLINQGANVVAQHQENILTSENGQRPIGQSAGSEYRSGIFWGQISGGVATQSSTPSLGGYSQTSYGITVGTDTNFSQNTNVGLAFSWMHGSTAGNDSLSGMSENTDSYQITTYGTHRFGASFVDGMLGLGYNQFHQSRGISFLGTTATADYGGLQYMMRLEGGRDFSVPNMVAGNSLTLTPTFGFQAIRSDSDSYTEKGAGAADLTISRQIVNSYATNLGIKAVTNIPTSWGDLKPEIKLAWAHDLNNSPISTNATLAGVGFTTATPRVAQDGAQTNLALTLQKTDTLSMRLEYDADLRSGFQSHTGLVKIEWNY